MDSHKLMYLLRIFFIVCKNAYWVIKNAHYINLFLVLNFIPYVPYTLYSLVLHSMNILSNLPTFRKRLIGEQKTIECLNTMRLMIYVLSLIGIAFNLTLERLLISDWILILTGFFYMSM